jgi:DNA-binding protein HU-beta
MNKQQIIDAIAKQAGINKQQATAALQAFEASVTSELADGGTVTLTGFGTFSVKQRAARSGRNPKTGETIIIAESKVPAFKAGKGLKEAVV